MKNEHQNRHLVNNSILLNTWGVLKRSDRLYERMRHRSTVRQTKRVLDYKKWWKRWPSALISTVLIPVAYGSTPVNVVVLEGASGIIYFAFFII